MRKQTMILALCLLLALSLLSACGDPNSFGESTGSFDEQTESAAADTGSAALRSMTTVAYSEGEPQNVFTIHYAENGLAETIEYTEDGESVSVQAEYTFDDEGSPITATIPTEDDPFSVTFDIDYGGIVTVALASYTAEGETYTEFSNTDDAPLLAASQLFRLIEHFDGFRNATLYIPGTAFEQRMTDGEVVYSSTQFHDVQTINEVLHNPDGSTTTVITTSTGSARNVQSIQTDAERRPTRYEIFMQDGKASFDLDYTAGDDGFEIGKPKNIEISDTDAASEMQSRLENATVCQYSRDADGARTVVEQYAFAQSESGDGLTNTIVYDAQGRLTEQTNYDPVSGMKIQTITCTYR